MRFNMSLQTSHIVLALFLTGALLVSGCAPIKIMPTRFGEPIATEQGQSSLMKQANAAWNAGNALEAERLYSLAAKSSKLSLTERTLAWERAARSALASGRTKSAEQALEQWKRLTPDATSQGAWQQLVAQIQGQKTGGAFHSGCVALALPMSGSYKPIGSKVAQGATTAQEELNRNGYAVDLHIVDTQSADWLNKLEQLPPQCVAVGGPLRLEGYLQAKAKKLTDSKAFFAFMPRLEGGDEGKVAWRFFSSPEDQVRTVLSFAGEMGVDSYGVLAPQDSYGSHMTTLFTKLAQAGGKQVRVTRYDPRATANMNGLMKQFTGSYMKGKVPVPTTRFQAAFLPDSWENLELIIPYLFYQGEDRLILMGTSLWEQGLSNQGRVNVANMDLAVFPGAWNPAAPHAAAATLVELTGSPDFWVAFGYDFVRFASALNLKDSKWSVSSVNARIRQAQNIDWSMAPIVWTNGRAAQQLFLFHPVETGFELVDKNAFRDRLKTIRARHARRVGK